MVCHGPRHLSERQNLNKDGIIAAIAQVRNFCPYDGRRGERKDGAPHYAEP